MQLSFCLLIWPFSVNSNCNFLVAQAFLISTPIGEPCWPQLQPFLSTSLWPGLNLAPSQLTWSSVVASFLVSQGKFMAHLPFQLCLLNPSGQVFT